ncbi:MAG: arsinothricin resistance N-acetyltransferase ArsN1 family B [Alphaproteobacteria bacterium]
MKIRVAEPRDAEAIAAIYAPIVRDTAISFETEPPGAAEMAARIEATLATHPWLVAEDAGRVLGYAYGSQHRVRAAYRWSCDVTVYVDASARRRGLGRRLYGRLFTILAAQGLQTAYAGITLPNAGSVGLHESCGFTRVGVFKGVGYKSGAWRDVGWWGLKLQAPGADPVEPIPFAAMRHGHAAPA